MTVWAEVARLQTENAELRAEIERLQAAVQTQGAEINRHCNANLELHRQLAALKEILREINATCYIPSGSRHAYTHFQADFDKIRGLTAEWHK